MTISISASGIALDGPLVAGEKVAVTVSGIQFAEGETPTLALLARFPDALLASVELAEDTQTPGTWTGELDTATKQTALFFATARADERREAALELVAGRVSLARLTVPMANSALCPKPDGSPFASPVYIPVPGPPGQGGDPYDQAPEMDGEGAAGTATAYARGDHVHPTDTSRMAATANGNTITTGGTSWGDAPIGVFADNVTRIVGSMFAAADVAPDYDATRTYNPNDYCTYIGSFYKCTAATSGEFDINSWSHVTVTSQIPAAQIQSDWNQTNSAAVDYIKNKPSSLPNPQPLHVGVMNYDGSTEKYVPNGDTIGGYGIVTLESATNSTHETGYAATPLAVKTVADSVAAKATATAIAPAFSTSSTYAVGDYVTYEGLLYKCTAAVSTAGSWNAANWTAVAVTDEMGSTVRYSFASPTPTVSGTSATVACEDRAINDFTVATGITSLTITPPAAVTGRARDFFCRVTLTDSSLPTVTLSGGTIDIGATEVAGMTQGVNLLMFTEIASGHWLASRRSAS